MKIFSNICFFVIVTFVCNAQTRVTYNYDNSGNREIRTIIMPSTPPPNDKPPLKSAKAITEKDSIIRYEDKFSNEKIIIIYPNPTCGKLSIDLNNFELEVENRVTIYSIKGIQLFVVPIKENHLDIDLTSHPSGQYILKIFVGKEFSEWKIIKR